MLDPAPCARYISSVRYAFLLGPTASGTVTLISSLLLSLRLSAALNDTASPPWLHSTGPR